MCDGRVKVLVSPSAVGVSSEQQTGTRYFHSCTRLSNHRQCILAFGDMYS